MAIAAYLRVSTERQDLNNQRYAVGEHCKAHGLTLGDVVTDTKSGKLSWRDRDLASLIERLAPGDILVTPELSRLQLPHSCHKVPSLPDRVLEEMTFATAMQNDHTGIYISGQIFT